MQKLAQTHCHTHTNRALSHSLHMDSFWRKQTCQHPSQRFSATLMPTAGIPLSLPARQTQTQMWGGTQHYFCYAGSYFTETSFLGVNGWKFPHKTFIFDQNCLINTAWTVFFNPSSISLYCINYKLNKASFFVKTLSEWQFVFWQASVHSWLGDFLYS